MLAPVLADAVQGMVGARAMDVAAIHVDHAITVEKERSAVFINV
jgi:hypothetical protein